MYRQLSHYEREQIGMLKAKRLSSTEIGIRLKRNPSTIRRELKRLGPRIEYSPLRAHTDARNKRTIPRTAKKLKRVELWELVQTKLRLKWSPEQIAQYLKRTYALDTMMHVSHETIYTYLYTLPRGALRKELIAQLRQGARGRQNRKRDTDRRGIIPNMLSIHERPAEVADRCVPGHWESDLIVGKDHASAVGTLVERTTRTTILVPLKAKDAVSVRKAFAQTVNRLPQEVFKSITHDRGSEMSQHELFTKDTKVQIYFADPQSPWQRGTNENTNGLIRQYFPKGTDFSLVSKTELKRVQKELNQRPRETLDLQTPEESFARLLGISAVGV
jgi:IS30 family transposase